jgi:SAM-dependent methyltransferase
MKGVQIMSTELAWENPIPPEQPLPYEAAFDHCICRLIATQICVVGAAVDDIFHDSRFRHYGSWLTESSRLIREAGVSESDSSAWRTWHNQKAQWLLHRNYAARVELVEAMMIRLPDILSGRLDPLEVMFPGGSLALVTQVYSNDINGYCNNVVAGVVSQYLDSERFRLKARPARIIEVGAGTGDTTNAVLAMIERRALGSIDEYCYTDISARFVSHGRRRFGCGRSYMRFRPWNIEMFEGETAHSGQYDVAVGANVFHATRSIEESLRNVRGVLQPEGMLVLHELSQASIFTHATFGLLAGWWRAQDLEYRISGSPVVAPASWERALFSAGFASTGVVTGLQPTLPSHVMWAAKGFSNVDPA